MTVVPILTETVMLPSEWSSFSSSARQAGKPALLNVNRH
jgi:hypothetical protein